MRACHLRVARLVETDVAVGAEAEELEILVPDPGERVVVPAAFQVEIGRAAVQEMRARRLHVEPVQEMPFQESLKARVMVWREADELVQREGLDQREVDTFDAVQSLQLPVGRD